MKIIYTTVEAAEKFETSPSSISRAARAAGVGVRRSSDNRLVGLSEADLKVVAKKIRREVGNPNWIAKGRKKKSA
jgi:hypothetical protein